MILIHGCTFEAARQAKMNLHAAESKEWLESTALSLLAGSCHSGVLQKLPWKLEKIQH